MYSALPKVKPTKNPKEHKKPYVLKLFSEFERFNGNHER